MEQHCLVQMIKLGCIIMSMAEHFYHHPESSTMIIRLLYSWWRKSVENENFDVEAFHADYAYTIDGGNIAEIEYENFNAFKVVEITGKVFILEVLKCDD